MSQKYWKEPPTKPLRDWRTYLIGVPNLCSATGACVFMALSFSFSELEAIPPTVRVGLVIVAAFATAIGSAFGSIGSGIEVYRKAFEQRAIWLDWTSLTVSVLATLGGFVMGFAALLGATAQWSEVARTWGPVVLSALVALDNAGDLIELGGIFAAYNIRYETWQAERLAWDAAHAPEPQPVEPDPRWPTAHIDDFRKVLGRLNGGRAGLTEAQLEQELAKDELLLPSASTARRWLKLAQRKG